MFMTRAIAGTLLLSLATSLVGASQAVFNLNSNNVKSAAASAWNDEGAAFQPVGDLNVLSEESFTTLEHPLFPKYSVRVKKSKFCDETQAYTGYIDIQAHHLFFYFFESRNDPDTDDVVFWTNGGPGGSSAFGLFMELGPCRALDKNGATRFEYSWNTNANIFFIDQPAGVGFSYSDLGEVTRTTEDAAVDIAAFVAIFFEHFTKFKGRAFHMAGESYGGRYVPLFASAVYDQNALLVEHGLDLVNLTSIMIGNGRTNWVAQTASSYDMLCTAASVPPLLSIESCVQMKRIIPRCEKWMKKSCEDHFDLIDCSAALNYCNAALIEEYMETLGGNPYDISKSCEGEAGANACYDDTLYIIDYLNTPSVRRTLGVSKSVGNFSLISLETNTAFILAGDIYRPADLNVAALLERGVRTLIYAGSYDFICNWVGNERWTRELEWSGQEEFAKRDLEEWKFNGTRAGLFRSANGLTFATIDGAGHMAPYDKPAESLELAQLWLAGKI